MHTTIVNALISKVKIKNPGQPSIKKTLLLLLLLLFLSLLVDDCMSMY